MSNNLSVKITADIIELQTKFAVARAETSALTAEMSKLAKQSAAGVIDAAGTARLREVTGQMLRARAATADLAGQLRAATGEGRDFGSSLEGIRSGLASAFQVTGAAAAYGAIRKVGQAIEEAGDRAVQMRSNAEVLGITTAQFQTMGVAAEESGVGVDALSRAAEKLKSLIEDARAGMGSAIEKLHTLGITNAEIASATFQVNDALQILHDRLNDDATATETMSALTLELGARGALAAAALKVYDGSAAGVAQVMARINGLSDEQIQGLSAGSAAWHNFGTWIGNAASKMLLFAENVSVTHSALSDSEDDAIAAAQARLDAAGGSTRTARDTGTQAQIDGLQEVAVTARRTNGQVMANVLATEREEVQAAASGTAQRLALAKTFYQDSLRYYGSGQVDAVQSAYREMTQAQTEYNRATLEGLKEQAAQAKAKYSDDANALRETVREMESGIKELTTTWEGEAKESLNAQMGALDVQLQAVKALAATQSITADQELQKTKEILGEQLAARMQYYDELEKLATLKPGEGANVGAEEASAQMDYLQKVQSAQTAATAEAKRQAQEQASAWKSSVNEIESAESSMISDLLSKRKSFSQSLIQISGQIVQKEIQDDLKAMTTKLLLYREGDASQKALEQGGLLYHLMVEAQKLLATQGGQSAQTAATITGGAARTAATASAAASAKAVGAAAGASTVMADAAKAFSGTYASVAQIPYVGWIMAPVAAAGAFAAVAGYEGLASLDVGAYNVPQDMVAQIHKGETVVPTTMAQGMRDGDGFSGGGGGGDTHHHYSIHAVDASSFTSLVQSPNGRAAIASAVRMHVGRGGR